MTREVSVTLSDNDTPVTTATVTLSDATATYGIRDAVSNDVVVAAGTAVPHVGNGVYTYAFDDAEEGVEYEATVKIVWPDGAVDYVDRPLEATTAEGPGDVDGRYATYEGVRRVLGTTNLKVYSQLENDDTGFDYSTIAADIESADDWLDLRAARGKYFQYAGPFDASTQFWQQIRKCADYKAAAYLVEHRAGPLQGLADEDFFRVMNGLHGAAEKLAVLLFDSDRQLNGTDVTNPQPKPGTFQSVPLIFERDFDCDEFSNCG